MVLFDMVSNAASIAVMQVTINMVVSIVFIAASY